MNLHLVAENLVLSVVYLRNSGAHVPYEIFSGRLDDEIFSRNLLRTELINASQV